MDTTYLKLITKDLKEHKDLLKNKSYHKSTYQIKNNKKGIEVNAETKAKYFSNAVTNDVELISRLGRKWRTNVAIVGAFVDLYQYLTPNKKYVPLPISTHSKRLLQIFKTSKNIERMINTSIDIGLLYCKSSFSSYTKGICREYFYNKDVQNIIKDVIKKYSINIKNGIIVNHTDTDYIYTMGDTFATFKVKFSSKLRIGGVKDEKQLMPILYEKYPQLEHYQLVADRLNEDLPAPLQIKFTPTFSFSKGGFVTKIGIRATNSICSLKEHENENKEYDGVWRKDFLKEYFGTEDYYEYDVKSSIYRVAYLLKTGEWADEDVDFYELMNGAKFVNKEEREDYKQFAQRLYFDSPAKIYNNIRSGIASTIDLLGENTIRTTIETAKRNMESIVGETLDSEIFLHESCIYMEFFSKLKAMDLDVVQVYDGFYCKEDLSMYKDLLKGIAEEYYLKYMNKKGER